MVTPPLPNQYGTEALYPRSGIPQRAKCVASGVKDAGTTKDTKVDKSAPAVIEKQFAELAGFAVTRGR